MASDRYSMSLTRDDTGEDARRFTPEHAYDAQPRTTLTFEVDGVPVLTFRSAETVEMRAPGPIALDEMMRKANANDDLAKRVAAVVKLHTRRAEPTHGCCARPKLCNGHGPECGAAEHGISKPPWPCPTLRALDIESVADAERAGQTASKGDADTDAFAKALGGYVGGHVYDDRWECVCGEGEPAANSIEAAMALYFHRRQHQADERAEGT